MSGYIGTQPVPQATQTRDSFTATSGQTSFATGGYTPNFLDVYLNGVKLASADYTATNGSDVVLASGASTGDILEVVAYTAFDTANVTGATDFTVTGAFTSQGIDDNADAVALTIDSSENVLIGKTATGGNVAGMQIINGSFFSHVRDGGVVQVLNRKSSDGDILSFEKDNTTVGSIGSVSGATTYIDGGSGFSGIQFGGDGLVPRDNGALADNTSDLGTSSYRFKDAYLSGGIYLGGVGSANKLEDYEEGTFTPNLANCTIVTAAGKYTKVGRQVFIKFQFRWNSFTGSTNTITGLPFTSDDYGVESMGFSVYANSGFGTPPTDKGYLNAFVTRNGSSINFTWQPNTVNANFTSGGNIYVAGVYNT